MTGTQISDMTLVAFDDAPDEATAPWIVAASAGGFSEGSNYRTRLVEPIRERPTSTVLAADDGATLIGSDDGAAGSLWTTVAGFITYLSASAGSAIVGFLQAGTGAVARTTQAKLRDHVDAFDFIPVALQAGIIAGSNTDDLSGYLQAALNTGRIVQLPCIGLMWIASPLLVPAGGGIVGGGPRSIIKAKANFGDVPLIRNANDDPATMGARDYGLTFLNFKVDGNKAANSTGTEFSHCIHLLAVDGAVFDVWTVDPKGDGVLISYSRAFDESSSHPEIGCRGIHGYIRSETAARQGVAITCCEAFDLSIFAYRASLLGFDIEPDSATSYVRNGIVRLVALECGQAGSGTRGGCAISGTDSPGTGVADVRDIDVTLEVDDCLGSAGFLWRDASLTVRGSIRNQTGQGVYGFESNVGASRVVLDLDINTTTSVGFLSRATSVTLNGSVRVKSAGEIGVQIENAVGGVLQVWVDGAIAGAGLYLSNTDNMTFPNAVIAGANNSGVELVSTSSGNRFPGLSSTGSAFGWGFLEASGCNNNQATDARISGNNLGTASLQGAASIVTLEQVFGKATFDPGSLATGASTAVQTMTVTGAAVGYPAGATFSNNLAGVRLTSWASAADTLSYYFTNDVGANPTDLSSGTVKGFVTPTIIA